MTGRASTLVAAAATLLGSPAAVRAAPGGGLTASAGLRYTGGRDSISLAIGARLWRTPGWAAGLDLAIGGGADGVAYEAVAWPLGAGLRVARWLDLAARVGGGVEGMTGVRPAGAPLAGELTCEADVHRRAHLGLGVRVAWIALAPTRGAALAAMGADELTVLATLRLGRTMHEYNGRAGRGLVLHAGVRIDHAGSALIVGLGLGVDARWAASPAPFAGWLRETGTP